MNWQTMKFIDFILLQRGYDLTKAQIKSGIYPVVTSTSIMGYHNAYKAEGPGVVTGRSGTIGEVQYVEENYWPHNTSLYVKDFKGNYPKFVYYFMKNFGTDRVKSGSAVPTLNRNNLSGIDVTVPDIEGQIKISDILSSYDNLIENNQKQIKLLEEAAQRLYKEWFVDLHLPGYEDTEIVDGVPEGWSLGILDDIAIDSGKKEKKEKRNEYNYYLPIDCLPKQSLAYTQINDISLAESSLVGFKKNDILFGAMRPYFHKVVIARDKGLTRTTCFVLNSKNELYWSYVVMILFSKDTVDYATQISVGTTMPYVRWKDMKNMPIAIPDETIAMIFNEKILPITKNIAALSKEIILLQQARDRLLPKLMSGEMEV